MLLIRFFHERLLYRLSISQYRQQLLLKGGNLLYSWQGKQARPTVDIDLAGQNISNDIESIKAIFFEILNLPIQDEVGFDTANMQVFEILEQKQYAGIRLKVPATLGKIKYNLQVDIGYADIITPAPVAINFPVLLPEFDSPQLYAYTIETVIAEKLHAMLVLGQINSRMKDFFDVYHLLQDHQLDKKILKTAIEQTFRHRKTAIQLDAYIFTEAFYSDPLRNKMWHAFLKKIKALDKDFATVVSYIRDEIFALF
jgi:predicted nucleotidyltransferase component of viral defense system